MQQTTTNNSTIGFQSIGPHAGASESSSGTPCCDKKLIIRKIYFSGMAMGSLLPTSSRCGLVLIPDLFLCGIYVNVGD
jgi:hypothetical protein